MIAICSMAAWGASAESFQSLAEGGPSRQAIECEFDGVLHRFAEDSLDRIELAHAITVHKAQGSQFRRVIIPVVQSRLLDRTLVYTALTRAVDQVVFVGDRRALVAAIEAPPRSQQRRSDSGLKSRAIAGAFVFPETSWWASASVSTLSTALAVRSHQGRASRAYHPELAGSKHKSGGGSAARRPELK